MTNHEAGAGGDGRFEFMEILELSDTATVFRARDRVTGQIVAIKELTPAHAQDPAAVARFEREIELAGRDQSPDAARVLGYGRRGSSPYVVMEFVAGLKATARKGSASPTDPESDAGGGLGPTTVVEIAAAKGRTPLQRWTLVVAGAALLAVLVAAITIVPRLTGDSSGSDKPLAGTWQYTGDTDGTHFSWRLNTTNDGKFTSNIEVTETGTYSAPSNGALTLAPEGGRSRTATWAPKGDAADQATGVEPLSFIQFAVTTVGNKSGAFGAAGYNVDGWKRSSRTERTEVWTRTSRLGPVNYDLTLEFGAGKTYSLRIVAAYDGTVSIDGRKMLFVSTTSGIANREEVVIDTDKRSLSDGDSKISWAKVQ